MAVTKKIVYSGDKFREYLNRHKITYQEASLQLGIDKNTIGKAVRGGNLNLNVLLTICNFYGLDISEFLNQKLFPTKITEDIPLRYRCPIFPRLFLLLRKRLPDILSRMGFLRK